MRGEAGQKSKSHKVSLFPSACGMRMRISAEDAKAKSPDASGASTQEKKVVTGTRSIKILS